MVDFLHFKSKYLSSVLVGISSSVLTLGCWGVGPVQAQTNPVSQDTTMTVAVEDVVVLTVPSSITLTLTAQSSANSVGNSNVTLSYDPQTGFNAAGAVDAAVVATPTTFSGTVQINNFWAVNSMSSSLGTSTQVSVAFRNSENILNNGTDRITLTDLFTNTGTGGGSSPNIAFPPTGLNPAAAQTGNVSFVMDLSQATRSGIYTGVVITVEAKTL